MSTGDVARVKEQKDTLKGRVIQAPNMRRNIERLLVESAKYSSPSRLLRLALLFQDARRLRRDYPAFSAELEAVARLAVDRPTGKRERRIRAAIERMLGGDVAPATRMARETRPALDPDVARAPRDDATVAPNAWDTFRKEIMASSDPAAGGRSCAPHLKRQQLRKKLL